ncbi:MAG: cbb3-type cytochrome oxidase assembly protein CcoS [Bacteroidota bacterium]
MKVIILLIFASLIVAIGFLIAFFWSVKTGQFDDDTSPAVRILMDNEITTKETNKTQSL